MLEIKVDDNRNTPGPKLMVIGVGGGGNNAINRMAAAKLEGVSLAAVNTDMAVLNNSIADYKIQIGAKLLKGFGAGADPLMGEAAALENEEELRRLVEGMDMVIITCGMGGGTGTGAAPVIARLCRELEILTMGIVTLPFSFESTPRMVDAEAGVEKMREQVDTMLVIPNDKLIGLTDKPLMLEDAFETADSVLLHTIEGISNIVYNNGTVNIDFNDIRTTLAGKGQGHLGIGIVEEGGSVLDAVKQAIDSPLLDTRIEGASNLLVNTSGRVELKSLSEAVSHLREIAGSKVNVIWGTVSGKKNEENQVVVTLIATGMPEEKKDPMSYRLRDIEIPGLSGGPRGAGTGNPGSKKAMGAGAESGGVAVGVAVGSVPKESASRRGKGLPSVRMPKPQEPELEIDIPAFLVNYHPASRGKKRGE